MWRQEKTRIKKRKRYKERRERETKKYITQRDKSDKHTGVYIET